LERVAPLVEEWRFLEDDDAEPASACDAPGAGAAGTPAALELVAAHSQAPLIAQAVLAAGAQLHALAPRRTSLEQLFLDIVGTEDSGQ
jgi:hypothetical protein